jgi:hypothetical protein
VRSAIARWPELAASAGVSERRSAEWMNELKTAASLP